MTSEARQPFETGGNIQHSAVARILDVHYEDIITIETIWETIDSETHHFLSDEHLSEIIATLDAGMSDRMASGLKDTRAYRKGQSGYNRQLRKNVTTTIAHAKWEAQLYVWGDDELRAALDKRGDISAGATDPYDIHMLRLQGYMTSLFKRAYGAERRLLEPFFELIGRDAEQIEGLTEFLTDKQTPLDEYTGLLIALARNHYDPTEDSVIDPSFSTLASNPQTFKESFLIGALLAVQQNRDTASEELSTTEQWLRMIGRFTVSQSVPLENFVRYVVAHPYEDRPESAKEELAEAFRDHLGETKQTLISLITKYRLPHRFALVDAPQSSDQILNRHKRAGGKRVTQKTSGKEAVRPPEAPPKHPIDSVLIAKQIGESWHATEALSEVYDETSSFKDWRARTTAAIMAQKLFSAYTTRHRNADDIQKMIEAILEDPKGNGSHPMEDQKVSLLDPRTAHAKRRHVYEFSPNDSTGIGMSQSPESNRTRIYYCVSNGQIVLLDIKHKTVAENMRGRFRRK